MRIPYAKLHEVEHAKFVYNFLKQCKQKSVKFFFPIFKNLNSDFKILYLRKSEFLLTKVINNVKKRLQSIGKSSR